MKILIISDIHANYPALEAIADFFRDQPPFDLVLNGGDTTVYGPFPNETIDWLRQNKAISITGNTDRHIVTLLAGKTFKKPRKAEKRIMYGWTAAELTEINRKWLKEQPLHRAVSIQLPGAELKIPPTLGMYHGSPDDPDEFLFTSTPNDRFTELSINCPHRLITVGHSHSPFHKKVGNIHFINPGSVGRMFDGNPDASCAVAEISGRTTRISHYRIPYQVKKVIAELDRQRLPKIYQKMYRMGRKLN